MPINATMFGDFNILFEKIRELILIIKSTFFVLLFLGNVSFIFIYINIEFLFS